MSWKAGAQKYDILTVRVQPGFQPQHWLPRLGQPSQGVDKLNDNACGQRLPLQSYPRSSCTVSFDVVDKATVHLRSSFLPPAMMQRSDLPHLHISPSTCLQSS